MTEPVLTRLALAADTSVCDDCGQPIATRFDLDTIPEGHGTDLCWKAFGDCGRVFGKDAPWREWYAEDVPRLLADLSELRVELAVRDDVIRTLTERGAKR